MGQLVDLLTPGSAVTADGMLTLAGCRADELAAAFGTPVMIVDEPALRARAGSTGPGARRAGPTRESYSPQRRSPARRFSG